MYDRGKILTGLVLFVLIILSPFIFNATQASGQAKPEPSLDTPKIQALTGKKCIEPAEVMRKEHMQLLNQWRDAALRDGNTVYVNGEGKTFEISLQNTCLDCHSNQEQFCAACHNYTSEKPYCWDCHISEKGAAGNGP